MSDEAKMPDEIYATDCCFHTDAMPLWNSVPTGTSQRYIRADIAETRAASVPCDKERAEALDLLNKAYLNNYGTYDIFHDKHIEVIRRALAAPQPQQEIVDLNKVKQEAVRWYIQKYDSPGVIGMPSDREVLYGFIDHLSATHNISKKEIKND